MVASVALLASACSSDDDSTSASSTPETEPSTTVGSSAPQSVPTTDAKTPEGAPSEVSANPTDWVLPGRDYSNSRATFDSALTAANVSGLEPAWEAEMTGPLSTVPLIVGDVVYAQSGDGTIHAVDRDSGEPVWTSAPTGFNIGPFGVAIGDGRVFAVDGSTGVIALDAAGGDVIWTRDIVATPTTGIDIQPLYFDGLVFASTVPISIGGIYTGGDRGILHALDAETGEVVWTFDTVDSEDLWGNPEVNSGGGSWYPPAIDPERGLVYWGVANPAPFPGTPEFPNGSSRPGPNLYTDSAVALDIATGELRWYHQVFEHDLFDRDQVHTMIVDLDDSSDLVVTTGKGGLVTGVDSDTGEPRWETPVGMHSNDDLAELSGPTVIAPGTYGGVLTPPASADGVVYLAAVNAPAELSPDATAYFGAEMGTNEGEIAAIDAATGELIWSTDVPGDPLGAATVVNDLVLTSLLQGSVVALDRESGEIVHSFESPGGINGWMSVSADLVVVPVGNASPPRLAAYRLPG